ncbi:MAG: hypothetical protein ACJ72V_17610 [Nitrososphaeraceae archaeon]
MKIEFPLYLEGSIINDQSRATIDLLRHAANCLEEGNSECTMIDVRKALTNHLFKKKDDQWILDNTLTTGWISNSPTDLTEIYKDFLQRIDEGLHSVLKITNKFLHDDNTIKVPPLRKDSEYVYFTTAFIVKHILRRLEIKFHLFASFIWFSKSL